MVPRLLLLTFLESISTFLLERGVYFYTEDKLGFSPAMNLLLAFVFGLSYIAGAQLSHRISKALGERRGLLVILGCLLLMHAATAAYPTTAMVWLAMIVTPFAQGAKWPIIESYVSAGQTPANASRVIGGFNVAWSSAVPVALISTGPLISTWPPLMFIVAGALNVVTLGMTFMLPVQPRHLAHDHPERLSADAMTRYRLLLSCSRWSMLGSFTLLFVLGPLMPEIFKNKLGFGVSAAASLSATLDSVRVIVFLVMTFWAGWHGRWLPLALGVVGSPIGFFMVLQGETVFVVLSGSVLFGLSAGVIYGSALYYAMVVHDAAVDAGGAHEAMIGTGFAIGPAIGLLGLGAVQLFGSQKLGMYAGTAPVVLITLWLGMRPIVALLRHRPADVLDDALSDPLPHIRKSDQAD